MNELQIIDGSIAALNQLGGSHGQNASTTGGFALPPLPSLPPSVGAPPPKYIQPKAKTTSSSLIIKFQAGAHRARSDL